MKAIHDWLVFFSLALMRFIPYAFWPVQTSPQSGSSLRALRGMPLPLRMDGLRVWPPTQFFVLQPFPVFSGAVDLVCQYFCRIKAEALFVIFHIVSQVAALVERIPRDGIQKGKAVHQTQMDLGSELSLGPGLSSDDGT